MNELALGCPSSGKRGTVCSSSLSEGNLRVTISGLARLWLCCAALGELLDVSVLRSLGMVLTGEWPMTYKCWGGRVGKRALPFIEGACSVDHRGSGGLSLPPGRG